MNGFRGLRNRAQCGLVFERKPGYFLGSFNFNLRLPDHYKVFGDPALTLRWMVELRGATNGTFPSR